MQQKYVMMLTDRGTTHIAGDVFPPQSGGEEVGHATIERSSWKFVEEGLKTALERRKPRCQYAQTLAGDAEAHLVTLVCGQPPEGRSRWTLRLLADRMVALKYVDAAETKANWQFATANTRIKLMWLSPSVE